MRQKLAIVGTLLLLVGVLVVINSATYVGAEEPRDSELAPNRSTYHAGATGARALYDFLNESGRKVIRWREIPEKLLNENSQRVSTFVIIGNTPLSIEEDEAKSLLLWVRRGGRLVLIDRRPELGLLPPSGEWRITTEFGQFPTLTIDPGSASEMTENVRPVRAVQPTPLTTEIDSVQPSRFAATISFAAQPQTKTEHATTTPADLSNDDSEEDYEEESPAPTPVTILESASEPASPAPVVHLGDSHRPLLVDYAHGQGRIVILADPYIVSNGGISLKDNLQLAINVVGANVAPGSEGLIAFDEYHHGRGTTRNAFAAYFAGTPILPLVGQIILLILLILWTQSRRFARPVPLEQIDRRSTLEFVASMAELQQRARAYDLALENIYSRTRRVLARYAGTDYNSTRTEIATRVAARSSLDARSLEVLMRQCEAAINGEPLTEKQSIYLVKRLREVEGSLGLRMRSRDMKQASQNL